MNPMTVKAAPRKANLLRYVLAGAIGVAGLSIQTFQAAAVSDDVKNACLGDYLAYCSAHEVGSTKLRQCMRSVGSRLSTGCINALVNAGEVGRPKNTRRSANLR